MYIANWIYRYHHEHVYDPIVSTSGVVEASVGMFGVLFTIFTLLMHKYNTKALNQKELSIYVLPVHEQFKADNKVLLNGNCHAKIMITN